MIPDYGSLYLTTRRLPVSFLCSVLPAFFTAFLYTFYPVVSLRPTLELPNVSQTLLTQCHPIRSKPRKPFIPTTPSHASNISIAVSNRSQRFNSYGEKLPGEADRQNSGAVCGAALALAPSVLTAGTLR